MWWITRSINEFTITLPPKSTFSMLMEPKEVTRWLWSFRKGFKRNRKDLSFFRQSWCSIWWWSQVTENIFTQRSVSSACEHESVQTETNIYHLQFIIVAADLWAYEGLNGWGSKLLQILNTKSERLILPQSPFRARVRFREQAHQRETQRKNARLKRFPLVFVMNLFRGWWFMNCHFHAALWLFFIFCFFLPISA